jgi:hypothetical protein
MNKRRLFFLVFACLILLCTAACSSPVPNEMAQLKAPASTPSTGQIFLYGEVHGEQKIMEEEFALWKKHYEEDGMRHLFLEYAYFTTEFLNRWMQADSDEILEDIYKELWGTEGNIPYWKDFFKSIKDECPETVFHGTDVGHQHHSTGLRYLRFLEQGGMKDSEQYRLARETIEQGKYYYAGDNYEYRENKMVENFIREFDALGGESVMGIYGSAHTDVRGIAFGSDSLPCMANQLQERYPNNVHTKNASDLMIIRTETIPVNGKDYTASYFGVQDKTNIPDVTSLEIWRLENAYDDFKEKPLSVSYTPHNVYPMPIEVGEVFIIEATKKDGSVYRLFFRSDGTMLDGNRITENFIPE